MARAINKKTIAKKDLKKQNDFKKYLAEIENPNYHGADASWGLPENANSLERAKYDLCESILGYQLDNNLSNEEIAKRINLTTGEIKDILYCHIDYFTLDRLISYAEKLFTSSRIKLTVEPVKVNKRSHARVI
jgi:predicted XRE-type DNA-binding protein